MIRERLMMLWYTYCVAALCRPPAISFYCAVAIQLCVTYRTSGVGETGIEHTRHGTRSE